MHSNRRSSIAVGAVLLVCLALVQSAIAQSVEGPPASPPKQLKAFNLKHADAELAAGVLTTLVESNAPFRAAIDERTNSLLISASKDSMSVIEKLIEVIDRESGNMSRGNGEQKETSYRVHIDWLLTTDRGQPVPAKLKEVELELQNHGIEGLQLAAATMASVQASINPEFQLSCSPLEDEIRLEINGTFVPSDGGNPGLEIEITAIQQREGSRNSAKPLAHVSTSVSARVGHPVVLAVAPIEGVSSVFVVTVEDAARSKRSTGNK
ncbi:secretin N-terminal domain-containing protein [Planctomycetota bacterium]